PRRRVVQEGLISKSLTAVAKVIQWLLLSLLFSIIIEWAGMVLWWPDEPACFTQHSIRCFLTHTKQVRSKIGMYILSKVVF
ncbi:MAG: hypothetical protein RPU13_14220, partial [Candidatus Sedimenticola sp. (ex Thyasira tokunagai)]